MGFDLFAREVQWRVVEVLSVTESEVYGIGISTNRVKKFWTYDGALKQQKKWKDEKVNSIIQGGIVSWIPEDDWDRVVKETDFMEKQNYDERERDI